MHYFQEYVEQDNSICNYVPSDPHFICGNTSV